MKDYESVSMKPRNSVCWSGFFEIFGSFESIGDSLDARTRLEKKGCEGQKIISFSFSFPPCLLARRPMERFSPLPDLKNCLVSLFYVSLPVRLSSPL